MKFYTKQHKYYCGIDLHARKMYVCILNGKGEVKVHQNISTKPEPLLELISPFGEDLVIGVECVFCWYWLADLCQLHQIPFILGHALYMKAIHGGKTKNDKIDSYKIALLLKGGNFPTDYPYPQNGELLVTCYDEECIFPDAAANLSLIFRIPTPNTTCRRSGKN